MLDNLVDKASKTRFNQFPKKMPFRNTEGKSFGNTLEEIQKLTIATVATVDSEMMKKKVNLIVTRTRIQAKLVSLHNSHKDRSLLHMRP